MSSSRMAQAQNRVKASVVELVGKAQHPDSRALRDVDTLKLQRRWSGMCVCRRRRGPPVLWYTIDAVICILGRAYGRNHE